MGTTSDKYFKNIYVTYYKKSFLFVKSYVHDDWAAEDITSEAFIRLWERLRKGEYIEYVEPLLFVILKNKALDYLKHEEAKRKVLTAVDDWQQREITLRISALEACDMDDIFAEEVRAIIKKTLTTLPVQTRKIFLLSRFECKSNKDIAKRIGISTKGVE